MNARKALQNDGCRAIRQSEGANDTCGHTNLVEIIHTRTIHSGIHLAEHANHFIMFCSVVNQMERTLTRHIDLRHHPGKHHHVSQRENGQSGRHALVEERGNIAFIIGYEREGARTNFIFIHCQFLGRFLKSRKIKRKGTIFFAFPQFLILKTN